MEVYVQTTQELKLLAHKLVQSLKPGDIIALYGDLGAGKTTLTKYIVEALQIEARVQSPTFVLHRCYKKFGSGLPNEITTVNHVDLYRITDVAALAELALDELWHEKNAITIIEWPQLVEDQLPRHISITLTEVPHMTGDARCILIEGITL